MRKTALTHSHASAGSVDMPGRYESGHSRRSALGWLASAATAVAATGGVMGTLSGAAAQSAPNGRAMTVPQDTDIAPSWPPEAAVGDELPYEPVEPPVVSLRGDIFGAMSTYVTWDNTNLLDLARSEELGLIELMAANPGVDPWYPGKHKELILPTAHILPDAPRQGIIVNIAELRIYYFHPTKGVFTFPLGVGKEGFSTPQGRTKIVRKKAGPAWYPTPAKRAEDPDLPGMVPAGPDNPLGDFALYLGWPTYLIHGTNSPWGVGRRVSRGCIRLYPEDIEWLFDNTPVGTPVRVVEQPIKIGHRDGEMFLEVHPTLAQIDQIEETKAMQPEPVPDLTDTILSKAGDAIPRIRWEAVDQALRERTGYPIQITG